MQLSIKPKEERYTAIQLEHVLGENGFFCSTAISKFIAELAKELQVDVNDFGNLNVNQSSEGGRFKLTLYSSKLMTNIDLCCSQYVVIKDRSKIFEYHTKESLAQAFDIKN